MKPQAITQDEFKALDAIFKSEYQDGRTPAEAVGHDVWTKYVNPFKNKRTQSGIYSSLSKKGLIQVGFLENGDGRNRLDTVNVTKAGMLAHAKAKMADAAAEVEKRNKKAAKRSTKTAPATTAKAALHQQAKPAATHGFVRVIDGKLGGDVKAMTASIARRFRVSQKAARQLLSDACERIEQACDDAEELAAIRFDDILTFCRSIRKEAK